VRNQHISDMGEPLVRKENTYAACFNAKANSLSGAQPGNTCANRFQSNPRNVSCSLNVVGFEDQITSHSVIPATSIPLPIASSKFLLN
jgi:hypothetical protein